MSITIHQSGIDAVKNAKASGFSGATLESLELWNEKEKIKTLKLEGVAVIEPSRIYVVAEDNSTDNYEVYAMKFLTNDATLFATAKNDDGTMIQAKASQSSLLLAYTLNLSAQAGDIVASGDVSMYAPPATETAIGTAEIATQEETNGGKDDTRIVTPKKLTRWWQGVKGAFKSAAFLDVGQQSGQVPVIGDLSIPGNSAVVVGSGSNANGYWVEYSNGMMLMWGYHIGAHPAGQSYWRETIQLPTSAPTPNYRIVINAHTDATPDAYHVAAVEQYQSDGKTASEFKVKVFSSNPLKGFYLNWILIAASQ